MLTLPSLQGLNCLLLAGDAQNSLVQLHRVQSQVQGSSTCDYIPETLQKLRGHIQPAIISHDRIAHCSNTLDSARLACCYPFRS